MASELRVNTLKDASGNNSVATSVVFAGTAKAWVNIDGTGTVAANDSFNLSGLTDNGTGDYTRTVTSAFNATTYSTSSGGGLTSASVGTISQHVNDAPTTTAIRVQTANFAMSALADFDFIELNSFGDLA